MSTDPSRPSGDSTFSLFFDSRCDVALDGVRAAATSGDVIHLAYAADKTDVVLDVTVGMTGALTVAGQVLTRGGSPLTDLTVAVHGGVDTHVEARGDAAGRFRLPAVPAPLTRFTADSGPVRIDLPLELP